MSTAMAGQAPFPGLVHVAVTREVKPGREAEFEARIDEFFARAEEVTGTRAYLIRPIDRGATNEYGILRSFASEKARDEFYASPVYDQWTATVSDLVVGQPERRDLHGLEAFFDQAAPPPRWKMAVLTWLAVNPAVYLSAQAVGAALGKQPMLVELLAVNVLVVAILTWAFMPAMTRLFGGWLAPRGA